jgi:hypothetical protein
MFTIILPACNEAKTLEKTVDTITKFVKKEIKENFLLIIAEDGSTDGTDLIAKSIEKKYKKVLHLHAKRRLGKGLALKRCSSYIRGDVVFFMDCGIDIDTRALLVGLNELRKGVEGPDIVIGSRYTYGSKTRRSGIRQITGTVYALMAKILFMSKINDFQCGFKGFKTSEFRYINNFVKSNDWFWDTEFIIRAAEADYAIKEIPVIWNESGDSKVNLFSDSWKMFWGLIGLRLETFKR